MDYVSYEANERAIYCPNKSNAPNIFIIVRNVTFLCEISVNLKTMRINEFALGPNCNGVREIAEF